MPKAHTTCTHSQALNEHCQLTLKAANVSKRQIGVKNSSFQSLADDNLPSILLQTTVLLFLISKLQNVKKNNIKRSPTLSPKGTSNLTHWAWSNFSKML